MDAELTELFDSASNYVRTIAGKLRSDDLLYLYARFKQANEGKCNVERPGFFDFQGKQKWDAWNDLKLKSSDECMLEYITKLTHLDPSWEEQVKTGSYSKSGLGIGVSRLADDEEKIEDNQKTTYDWCKEGNIEMVDRMLNGAEDIDALDDNGMSLLHWGCDRGHKDIVQLLIDRKANINIQDFDLQTPLHYAISCEYPEIAQILMSHGADANMKDSDGNSPLNMSESGTLSSLKFEDVKI